MCSPITIAPYSAPEVEPEESQRYVWSCASEHHAGGSADKSATSAVPRSGVVPDGLRAIRRETDALANRNRALQCS